MFGNLLGTVLGSTHQLTIAYRAFWTLLAQGYQLELQQIIDNKGYIKPAHVLRSIQLICYNWFNQKRHRLTPTSPDFAIMLQTITLNTYILPHLPPTLYKLAYPRPNTSLVPNLLTLTDASHSSSSGNTSGSSNASTISNLTSLHTQPKPAMRLLHSQPHTRHCPAKCDTPGHKNKRPDGCRPLDSTASTGQWLSSMP
jgi:hypothetical protein